MTVPVNEQETTISFRRDSKEACIWTTDTTVMNKLDKLCESSDAYECIDVGVAVLGGEIISKEYLLKNKTLLSFRGKKIQRELSAERREEISARMKAYHEENDAKRKKDAISD